jgi:hypothetical protein
MVKVILTDYCRFMWLPLSQPIFFDLAAQVSMSTVIFFVDWSR